MILRFQNSIGKLIKYINLNNIIIQVDVNPVMKIKVDAYDSNGAATTDGNYRINDITVVYRTTRKSPSTGVNS